MLIAGARMRSRLTLAELGDKHGVASNVIDSDVPATFHPTTTHGHSSPSLIGLPSMPARGRSMHTSTTLRGSMDCTSM